MGKMSISFRTHDHQKMSLLPKSLDQGSRPIKMGTTRPLFVYFRPFLNTITNTVQNLTLKSKLKWRAWNSNPGRQDGRHRRMC